MRKLRVFESVSVDGYFCGVDGDMSWAHGANDDAELAAWVSGNASSGAELVFGRKTYEMMQAFWPTPEAARQMPEVAKGMNGAKKHLASRTVRPTWTNTHLLEGDLVPAIGALKEASGGPSLTVLGSGTIATQLAEAGLVDEYQLVIVPVLLGAGRSVFPRARKLRRIEERAFPGGNVMVTYATS